MKTLVSLLLGAAVLLAGLASSIPPARACSIAEPFVVTAQHLTSGDMNEPDGALARDYHDMMGQQAAVPEVVGAYVVETVYTIEPDGNWTRGAVGSLVEVWGQWPEQTGPFMWETKDLSGAGDECPYPSDGPELGHRQYYVVTDQFAFEYEASADASVVLDAVFGAPDVAERDTAEEERLIASLQASRRTSTIGFGLVGVLAIGAAGAVMFYAWRKRVPAEASDQ